MALENDRPLPLLHLGCFVHWTRLDCAACSILYGLHKKIPQPELRDFWYDPYGNRTHVTAVKGPCLNRLTNGPYKIQDFAKTASYSPATIAAGPQVF